MFLNGWETITSLFYCFALLYNNNHGWHCLCSVCWFCIKKRQVHQCIYTCTFICVFIYFNIIFCACTIDMKRCSTTNVYKYRTIVGCLYASAQCMLAMALKNKSLEYVFSICVIPYVYIMYLIH